MKRKKSTGKTDFENIRKNPTRFEQLKEMHSKLPRGPENGCTDVYAGLLFKTSDRRARKIMTEEMRTYGLPVCNYGMGGGYFVPTNSAQLEPYYEKHHRFRKNVDNGDYHIGSMLKNMKLEERQKGVIVTPFSGCPDEYKPKGAELRKRAVIGL